MKISFSFERPLSVVLCPFVSYISVRSSCVSVCKVAPSILRFTGLLTELRHTNSFKYIAEELTPINLHILDKDHVFSMFAESVFLPQ